MIKPAFCICENKDADQLRNNCAADQRLCFRYIESTMSLRLGCTARFVTILVGNPEDRSFFVSRLKCCSSDIFQTFLVEYP